MKNEEQPDLILLTCATTLLLILSKDSVESRWVKHEVEAALYKEMGKESDVLFPIRIDNAVLESTAGWAARLRHRHISDFTHWKQHDDYQQTFTRLLRDLKADQKTHTPSKEEREEE